MATSKDNMPAFWRMYASGLLMSIGLFGAFAFLAKYAKEQGIEADRAAQLIVVLGVGSVAGRLLIGPVAARFGTVPPLVLSFFVQPIAYVFWWQAGDRYWAMAVFAGLLGVSYGGYVALSPVAASEIWGMQGLGGLLGILGTNHDAVIERTNVDGHRTSSSSNSVWLIATGLPHPLPLQGQRKYMSSVGRPVGRVKAHWRSFKR